MKLGIMPYVIDSYDFLRFALIVLLIAYALYMSVIVVTMVVKFVQHMLTQKKGGKKCIKELRNSSPI